MPKSKVIEIEEKKEAIAFDDMANKEQKRKMTIGSQGRKSEDDDRLSTNKSNALSNSMARYSDFSD